MTAYRRGVHAEKRVAASLRADGYEVVESRGSHGLADLVAIKPGQVLWLQVKAGDADANMRGEWINPLYAMTTITGGTPILADTPKGRIRLRRITGMHKERSKKWPLEPFTTDQIGDANG